MLLFTLHLTLNGEMGCDTLIKCHRSDVKICVPANFMFTGNFPSDTFFLTGICPLQFAGMLNLAMLRKYRFA